MRAGGLNMAWIGLLDPATGRIRPVAADGSGTEYLQGRENSALTSLYTAVLAQSNAMPDTTPKSNLARVFFMIQVSLGWLWFLLFT